MNTNTNIRHPTRSSRSAAIRVCVAFGIAASITAVGSMTSATATFRDPGPGSMGAFVRRGQEGRVSDDSVTFPYVESPCFAGRMTDRWAADVGAQRSASTSTERRRPRLGRRPRCRTGRAHDRHQHLRAFVAAWPFVDPMIPYPKRF